MARPERFELPTNWFEASYSIQLSYGRNRAYHTLNCIDDASHYRCDWAIYVSCCLYVRQWLGGSGHF